MSKRKLTYKDFLNYFKRKGNAKDMHDFEQHIMRDPFDEEAFDGLSKLSMDELESDITELRKTYISSDVKFYTKSWFKYAASIIILIGIGSTILFNIPKSTKPDLLSESTIIDSAVNEVNISVDTELVTENKKEVQKDIKTDNVEEAIEESTSSIMTKTKKMVKDVKIDMDEESVVVEKLEVTSIKSDFDLAFNEKLEIPQLDSFNLNTDLIKLELDRKVRKKTLIGQVTDSKDSLPIPGVTIMVPGSTIGTTTDFSGNYKLIVDDTTSLLRYAFVGMESKDVNIADYERLNVSMDNSPETLDEVVVTAMGVKREKKALGYSVGTVSDEEILKSEQARALKGKVAGVNIGHPKYRKLIKGQVTSADDGNPIPGVTIMVPGTTIGTTTDFNGEYELMVHIAENTLRYSFVGMESEDVNIDDEEIIDISMQVSAEVLNEVVVTGGMDEGETVSTAFGKSVAGQPDYDRKRYRAKPYQGYRQYKLDILEQLNYDLLQNYPGKHKIRLTAIIDEHGEISILILNAPNDEFKKEIVKAIYALGRWKAALQNNRPISSEVKLSFTIEIK